MKKTKKCISTALACALGLTVALSFTACDGTGSSGGSGGGITSERVTAKEWSDAFDFSGSDNFTLNTTEKVKYHTLVRDESGEVSYIDESGTASYKVYFDCDKYMKKYSKATGILADDVDLKHADYREEVGGKLYRIEYSDETGKYEKEEWGGSISAIKNEYVGSLCAAFGPRYDEFEYSANKGGYVLKTSFDFEDITVNSVTVKIKNGHFVYCDLSGIDDEGDGQYVSITSKIQLSNFGSTSVTLPKISGDTPDTPIPAGETVTLTLGLFNGKYRSDIEDLCDEFCASYTDRKIEIKIVENDSPIYDGEAENVLFICGPDLYKGETEPVSDRYIDKIKNENIPCAVEAVTNASGEVVGFPLAVNNSWFLWYDKDFYSQEDIRSLDVMAEKAAAQNKQIMFPFNNAWYNYSFFAGTGCTSDYGASGYYITDIDGENGIKAASAIGNYMRMKTRDGQKDVFLVPYDDEVNSCLPEGARNGNIVAGFIGRWIAWDMRSCSNFAVAPCPSFNVSGVNYQMKPFVNFDAIFVSPSTKEKAIAEDLAAYLSGEDAQRRICNYSSVDYSLVNFGTIPTNKKHISDSPDPIFQAEIEQIMNDQCYVQHKQHNVFWDKFNRLPYSIKDSSMTDASLQKIMSDLAKSLRDLKGI